MTERISQEADAEIVEDVVNDEIVADGTLVKYHGSIKARHEKLYVVQSHGRPQYADTTHLYPGGVAYYLAEAEPDGSVKPRKFNDDSDLWNVRSSSFTAVAPKIANPNRTKVE